MGENTLIENIEKRWLRAGSCTPKIFDFGSRQMFSLATFRQAGRILTKSKAFLALKSLILGVQLPALRGLARKNFRPILFSWRWASLLAGNDGCMVGMCGAFFA